MKKRRNNCYVDMLKSWHWLLHLFLCRQAPKLHWPNNKRICGDCHISKVRNCIIVRDASRYHHFSDPGKCSCGDYWSYVLSK